MSIKHTLMTWKIKFPGHHTGLHKLTALAISDIADKDGDCYPREKHLADYCGISERSVRSSIKYLSRVKFLSVTRRFDSTNLYHIIPIPKDWGIGAPKKKT